VKKDTARQENKY